MVKTNFQVIYENKNAFVPKNYDKKLTFHSIVICMSKK